MPRLTPDNLGYLARGVRRWLYGSLCDSPPECRAQFEARIADRTGRVAWLHCFGPAWHGGIISGEPYRLLWSVGLSDSWRVAAGIGLQEGRLPIEGTFERALAQNPPGVCDLVVILLERNRPTAESVQLASFAADEDFRACILKSEGRT